MSLSVVLGTNDVTIYRSRHWCWVAKSQTVKVYITYKLSAAVHLFWGDSKPLFLNNTIIQSNHNVKYMDSRSRSYHVEFQLQIASLFEPCNLVDLLVKLFWSHQQPCIPALIGLVWLFEGELCSGFISHIFCWPYIYLCTHSINMSCFSDVILTWATFFFQAVKEVALHCTVTWL